MEYELNQRITYKGREGIILGKIFNLSYNAILYMFVFPEFGLTGHYSYSLDNERINSIMSEPRNIELEFAGNIGDYFGQRYSWLTEKDLIKAAVPNGI